MYCDFYSEIAGKGKCSESTRFGPYADALAKELESRREELVPDTLYIGGGTPSVLPLSVIENTVEVLTSLHAGPPYKEFTIEVNPDDIVTKGEDYVRGLIACGVNRVSMGIQSFDDGLLKWMGRRHDSRTAKQACSILRAAGIENLSIDLIFGINGLSDSLWDETISTALSLDGGMPEHISAYQLSVEPGSALAEMERQGTYIQADEELCRRQYDRLCARLAEAGYRHYEISNFAKPGHEAKHNSAYWTGVPYSGFGPGAHSLLVAEGTSRRSWNKPSLTDYLAAAQAGDFASVTGSETLTPGQKVEERIMLALRTDNGIGEEELRRISRSDTVTRLLSSGLLEKTGEGNLRIPEKEFFVSDSILVELI